MDVIIPPNATAVVKLPDANKPDDAPGIEVGSGAHHFECWFRHPGRWPPQADVTSRESSNNLNTGDTTDGDTTISDTTMSDTTISNMSRVKSVCTLGNFWSLGERTWLN
ncbi:hypothetical protein PG993_004704 [Apiospora rasikravindrae]|uniref:Uncharacterized protein n=1 Tax=Apiospora rasikravindrae TaxID=990691 RepID=A0ABR1TDH7_9PEZI